ncbi:Uncharacterised protein [Bordetella pertussis]|nr:Uncharacterised protein [Bordetella pertussis]CFP69952.1 Uncharacterised protein [Bordetella pertussis]CFU08021.1 Uncharacterised protein [Bordetella pertussis]CFW11997.1 Uncharacterised protein [Bordetella pertussis]CFW43397.1 Uncharacterised protein [Bordetella pertussis]
MYLGSLFDSRKSRNSYSVWNFQNAGMTCCARLSVARSTMGAASGRRRYSSTDRLRCSDALSTLPSTSAMPAASMRPWLETRACLPFCSPWLRWRLPPACTTD